MRRRPHSEHPRRQRRRVAQPAPAGRALLLVALERQAAAAAAPSAARARVPAAAAAAAETALRVAGDGRAVTPTLKRRGERRGESARNGHTLGVERQSARESPGVERGSRWWVAGHQ